MFPLWDVAIAPVLHAAGATPRRGDRRPAGRDHDRMLDDLGPDAELHVIDPVPELRPDGARAAVPRALPLPRGSQPRRLPTLGPMDAALIDGDHNWYTVYNELRLLAEGARRHGTPLPVLILHDVLWPYGRRDLYYAPEQIPEEFRQPYATKGMRPGSKRLLDRGGLNPTMCNALEEGGPRNGVMTAVDDFVAGHDRSLRVVVLPVVLRPGDRRGGGASGRAARACGRPRSARGGSGAWRPPGGGRGGPAAGDDLPAQRVLPAVRRAGASGRPTPAHGQGGAAQRALHRP